VAGGKVRPLPGLAPVALQQWRYVGRKLAAELAGKTPRPEPFRYLDKGNLATVGRSFAIADLGKVKLSGYFAWLTWVAVHIAYLISFHNRLLVLIEWAWAYVTWQRGARIVTGRPQASASDLQPLTQKR
jgi:NADH:ubiquinone reductase (H+-translocating)